MVWKICDTSDEISLRVAARIWRGHIARYFAVPEADVALDYDTESNDIRFHIAGNASVYKFDTGHDDYDQTVFHVASNNPAFRIVLTMTEREQLDAALDLQTLLRD